MVPDLMLATHLRHALLVEIQVRRENVFNQFPSVSGLRQKSLFVYFPQEPSACDRPVTLYRGEGALERFSDFFIAHSHKKTHFDDFSFPFILRCQSVERVIKFEQFRIEWDNGDRIVSQFHPLHSPAPFPRRFTAEVIHNNISHNG
jgi:hypothetical protein